MNIATHSIAILVTALFSASILWGEHYHPWTSTGEMLDVRWNYVLGVSAMLIPFSLLLLFWCLVPPANNTVDMVLWSLIGLWVIVAVSGLVVHLMHEWDAKNDYRLRAEIAEKTEQVSREPTQSEG